MNNTAKKEAENFLNNEKQFHLGMLPTEQSNQKTKNLDRIFAASIPEGVKTLLSVDFDVFAMAKRVLAGKVFREMVNAGADAILNGKRIIFSGCGATGRLSILLESIWRCFFRDLRKNSPGVYEKIKKYENSVFSIMTGGDFALIRSVEFFEDYQQFGRQQVIETGVSEGDVLIAITEGGETSSVLGSVSEAAERGAKIFLLFNNPVDILKKYIERSRRAIEDPRVNVIDLFCGPMAIAGSTRMQATTSEQLVAGAALEQILLRTLENKLTNDDLKLTDLHNDPDYATSFGSLLGELVSDTNLNTIARYIEMEKAIYSGGGLVTYFANDFMLDIFTDTTERAPTFMLPPFRKFDDEVSPTSWAFVKNPSMPTLAAWDFMLGRPVRCLEWDSEFYRSQGCPAVIYSKPPQIDKTQIIKFHIGNEKDESRLSGKPNLAVNLLEAGELRKPGYGEYINSFEKYTAGFDKKTSLIIGRGSEPADYRINCTAGSSVLSLMDHMAIKLVLNTISTGTMILMGRVTGNWMSWVEVSNKKLRDRGIRLISEICGLSYEDACYALHESLEEMGKIDFTGAEKPSPVQYTIKKIKEHQN